MSTKARYGLYACAKLAQDYDKGFISTTELANAIYVSDGYLEQIVSLLKRKEWLSRRGELSAATSCPLLPPRFRWVECCAQLKTIWKSWIVCPTDAATATVIASQRDFGAICTVR